MRLAIRSRSLGAMLGVLVAGCGPSARGPGHAAATPAVADPPPPEPPPAPLAPLTPEEQEVSGRLRAVVIHLAVDIGERNLTQPWNLASATDELALELEKMGHSVRRQGFVAGDAVLQNLEVGVAGGERGFETIIVGAHFDTVAGSRGANEDASGVAAVMELSRRFREHRGSRSLRFVLFASDATPSNPPSSLVYAKDLVAQGVQVAGVVSVGGIGRYSTAPGSQPLPGQLVSRYPRTADFVAVLGNAASGALAARVATSMKKHASLPVVAEGSPGELSAAEGPSVAAFRTVGMPAVTITDTARLRTAQAGVDTPEGLDFDRMARVVLGLSRAIEELAAGP